MRHLLLAAMFVGYTAPAAAGQLPPQPPPPGTPPPSVNVPQGQKLTPPPGVPTPPQQPGRPTPPTPPNLTARNIRLEFTIADTVGADGPTKKTATLLVMNGRNGQIRSTGIRGIINVDAIPTEFADGRIRLDFTLEYMPEGQQQPIGKLTESLTVILDNGKPMIVTQSADPQSDRRVTVELTATLMK